jgi:hypothetical protein
VAAVAEVAVANQAADAKVHVAVAAVADVLLVAVADANHHADAKAPAVVAAEAAVDADAVVC